MGMEKSQTGLAVLVLSVVELLRQLMEAQILRRMEAQQLSEAEIERAGHSLQAMEQQILQLCDMLKVDPDDLNLDLGDFGKLLPSRGSYYPDQPNPQASVLELLDRLITTGIVIDGQVDIGLAQLDLIHLQLKVLLTSTAKVEPP